MRTLLVRPAGWYKKPETTNDIFKYWTSGKDFQIYNGQYVGAYTSIRDADVISRDYDEIACITLAGNLTLQKFHHGEILEGR